MYAQYYEWFCLSLQRMLPTIVLGCDVSVPSTLMAYLHNKIRDAYKSNDMETAQLWQVSINVTS